MNILRNNPSLSLSLVALLALGLGALWPSQLSIFVIIAALSIAVLLFMRLIKAWPQRNTNRHLLKLAEALSFLGALIIQALQTIGRIEGYNGLSFSLLFLGLGFLFIDRAMIEPFLAQKISSTNTKIGIAIVLLLGFLIINWVMR